MHDSRRSGRAGLALGLVMIGGAAQAADPPSASDPIAAIEGGKPILEVRARYEDVDQVNLPARGLSFTVRTRLGWETRSWNGLKALVEVENVAHLDDGHYNVAPPGGISLNGRGQYPIINDPAVTELNRAQIAWAPTRNLSVTFGRQRLLIDDQRFVGNVGWRQDEQTFDAVRTDLTAGPIKATYAYIFQVNRVFGQSLDWRSDSHLLNVSVAPAANLRFEGFVYALDFGNAAANSSVTIGARMTGKASLGPAKLTYDATYAHQTAYGNNPATFSLAYWQGDLAATWQTVTVKADYEQLDGDGVRGFITPLATTHGFQGWADAFAAVSGNKTHVDGIKDFNVSLAVRLPLRLPWLRDPEFVVRRHEFWAQRTGAKLAGEWDAQVQCALTPKLTAAIKYADFERADAVPAAATAAPPSRTKVWLTLEFKL